MPCWVDGAMAIGELVGCKVEAPALIGHEWHQHGSTRANGPFAASTLAHRELLLAAEPEQALVVDGRPMHT
jgi:hypothetical protein